MAIPSSSTALLRWRWRASWPDIAAALKQVHTATNGALLDAHREPPGELTKTRCPEVLGHCPAVGVRPERVHPVPGLRSRDPVGHLHSGGRVSAVGEQVPRHAALDPRASSSGSRCAGQRSMRLAGFFSAARPAVSLAFSVEATVRAWPGSKLQLARIRCTQGDLTAVAVSIARDVAHRPASRGQVRHAAADRGPAAGGLKLLQKGSPTNVEWERRDQGS